MTRVFPSTIACPRGVPLLELSALVGIRPNDPDWKSASKIGSRMSLSAPWTTRSRMEGIARTRTLWPPSFGISFLRTRRGRYVW